MRIVKLQIFIVTFITSLFLSATVFIVFIPKEIIPGPYKNPGGWILTFNEEFSGSSLNRQYWTYNYPNDWPHEGHTHNHQAYMDEANVLLENGILKLKGENSRHPNAPEPEYAYGKYLYYNYTAGAIHTQDKLNFTGGYIEGRFKMPQSRGFWPAFWMLKDAAVGLPEIDIIEVLTHNPNVLYTTVHYGFTWSAYSSFGTRNAALPDLSTDFHTYGVEVSNESLIWFFDGKRIGRIFRDNFWLKECNDLFIIINLAIGGWELDPNETTIWPAYFECDYVKIWQEK